MPDKKRGAYVITSAGGWSNQQLLKDCGIIPYMFYKNHGFRAVMVGAGKFEPEKFSYLEKYVRGLEMDFLAEDTTQARLEYVNAHAAEMDLLILYGAYPEYFPVAEYYKRVRPDGKIYLATDMNLSWSSGLPHLHPAYQKFFQSCDVVAASCRSMQKNISTRWRVPVDLIRNGWYNFPQVSFDNLFDQKENVILTVGRIGTDQKRNDILIEAFAKVAAELPDWSVRLVGNIDDKFKPYMENYFAAHPELKDRVIFTDLVEDKIELANEYKRAKIFCLTSGGEGGTPNVVAEALFAGCFMICSQIEAAYEVTDDDKCGIVFPLDGVDALADIFRKVCRNDEFILAGGRHAVEYACRSFDAEQIVARLHYMLFGGDA